ncbi:MAG TPA: ATP-binding cassette domain-containing protein, partial [Thauera sp.]|nr:ATP-binding cassette domain-containing protein [Thauera sp.]
MNAPLPADLPEAATAALLHVEGLGVAIARTDGEEVRPVDGVDFAIAAGETFALLGESGCGKSMTALALARLLPDGGRIAAGSVRLGGEDLLALPEAAMRRVRGGRIGMIFQEPSASLNPVMSVGAQIAEALAAHGLRGEAARVEACRLLAAVGIPDPERRLQEFPFQFSGGMKQRVMIAIALAGRPRLLIADEPTTALDVTIQAQILDLLAELKRDLGMSLLFITHDLGIVRKFADRVCVMKDGEIVETGPTAQIFADPRHPYTQMLLSAEATGLPDPVPAGAEEIAAGDNMRIWFPITRGLLRKTVGHIKAVNAASFSVREGETVGIVGESGSGKTTLALAMMRLIESQGRIVFLGQEIQDYSAKRMKPLRSNLQIVFQDPYGSLSPRMTAAEIIAEGLGVHG